MNIVFYNSALKGDVWNRADITYFNSLSKRTRAFILHRKSWDDEMYRKAPKEVNSFAW